MNTDPSTAEFVTIDFFMVKSIVYCTEVETKRGWHNHYIGAYELTLYTEFTIQALKIKIKTFNEYM